MRCMTRRKAPKSGVEKKSRTSMPVTPDSARVSTMWSSTTAISRRETGKLRASWPTTASAARSVDSTKPSEETPSSVSGMQQIRKKNASPAARKKPLSAKKRENAPRMASITRGSEQAAHQASVHLDGRACHVRGTLGGQEDDDVGELLRRAHAADRDLVAELRDVLLAREARSLQTAHQPVRQDPAGADGVERDVVLGVAQRERLDHAVRAGAHGVGQQEIGQRLLDRHGLDREYPAPLLRL